VRIAIGVFGVALALVIAMVLAGCPNPQGPLYFLIKGKVTQRLKIVLTTGAKTEIKVWTSYYGAKHQYKASFILNQDKFVKNGIEFNPQAVSISANGVPLRYRPNLANPSSVNSWNNLKGYQEYDFVCEIDSSNVPRDSTGHYLSMPVSVWLGEAFRRGTQVIPLDTLHGVDRKTDGIEIHVWW
jgi:hypothetical protein